jgi:hypothetical protein
MSYKLNKQDPTRRERILARRNHDGIPHAPMLVTKDKYGKQVVKPIPGAPAFSPNNGTPMKGNRRLAMVRWLNRNNRERLKEPNLIRAIRLGVATRREVYGFHPTKGK